MVNKLRYQRTILFFDTEDPGYGLKQEPSGYIKIEVKDGRGVLSVSAQNLKDETGLDYKAYIIKADQSGTLPVCAGNIVLAKNKGELHWNFEPDNVGDTGSKIDDFNVAAVICDNKKSSRKKLVCPLAAYKDKKVEWRGQTEQKIYPGLYSVPDPFNKEEAGDIIGRYGIDLQSKYAVKPETVYNKHVDTPAVLPVSKDVMKHGNEEVQPEQENNQSGILHKPEECPSKEEAPADTSGAENEESSMLDIKAEKGQTEAMPSQESNEDNKAGPSIPDNSAGQSPTDEMSNMCNPLAFDTAGNPCEGCSAMCRSGSATAENTKNALNIQGMGELKKTLAKYFDISDPFRSKRKDYQWWRAASAVQLNNILYQFNLRTPLLYNPKVLTAHFKYRHLIIGVYSDRITRLEYIVCGIPSVYGIDAKPFGEYCRWAQVEGNIPKYGAFGYWLIYINPRSGDMLRLG